MTEQQAAGHRPSLQTVDQQPSQRMTNKTFQSNIFGPPEPIQQSKPFTRTQNRPKTDIFNQEPVKPQVQTPSSRQHKTFQSSIFSQDNNEVQVVKKPIHRSSLFATSDNKRNNESRPQDHGKDYLFGRTDFNDYRTLTRVKTESSFKPRLDYNPENRQLKDLYATEITQEHFTTSKPLVLEKQSVKKENQNSSLNDLDPEERRQFENSSTIFNDDNKELFKKKKAPLKENPQQRIKTQEDQDPKNKKMNNLQSNLFGNEPKKAPQIDKTKDEKQKQIEQKKKTNQNVSEVFGVKEDQFQTQKKKERLLASNTDWTKVDTIKNFKDYAPGEDIKDEEVTPAQKKLNTFKSTLDTHNYEGKEQLEKNQKLTTKHFKYKDNQILTREEKKQPKKEAPSQAQSQALDDSMI